MRKNQEFYGWTLLAVLFSLDFVNMGFPVYGGTVINSYMLHQMQMSRSTLGLGLTLSNLFVGLSATFVAGSILKLGIRKTFAIGSALICAGSLFLAFFASKPWHYLLGYGGIIGVGMGFGTLVPAGTAVTRWFKRYRGRAMGICLGASGIAGFVVAPVLNKMLEASGGNWRVGWQIGAGVAVISGIMALLFVKERPEDLGQVVDGIPETESERQPRASHAPRELITTYSWTPAEAYRTKSYWLIVIAGITCQYPLFFFIAHWILHARGAGIPASEAAWTMSLFAIGGITGRLIGGWLMDTITGRYAFMIGLCLYLVGSFLAIRVNSNALVIAFAAAILYGLAFGWTFTCMNTCTAHFYGSVAFPKLNGTMILLTSVIGSPAGVIGGKIFDTYGGYARAFELNALLAAIGIIAMAFATMPRPRTTTVAPAKVA
ncbi:MAG TPA: MFS transporter [Candidatus Acidoferrales bacterium]|nr:MFS transporter [Candidatus Acidoferrales bacterium]